MVLFCTALVGSYIQLQNTIATCTDRLALGDRFYTIR